MTWLFYSIAKFCRFVSINKRSKVKFSCFLLLGDTIFSLLLLDIVEFYAYFFLPACSLFSTKYIFWKSRNPNLWSLRWIRIMKSMNWCRSIRPCLKPIICMWFISRGSVFLNLGIKKPKYRRYWICKNFWLRIYWFWLGFTNSRRNTFGWEWIGKTSTSSSSNI